MKYSGMCFLQQVSLPMSKIQPRAPLWKLSLPQARNIALGSRLPPLRGNKRLRQWADPTLLSAFERMFVYDLPFPRVLLYCLILANDVVQGTIRSKVYPKCFNTNILLVKLRGRLAIQGGWDDMRHLVQRFPVPHKRNIATPSPTCYCMIQRFARKVHHLVVRADHWS